MTKCGLSSAVSSIYLFLGQHLVEIIGMLDYIILFSGRLFFPVERLITLFIRLLFGRDDCDGLFLFIFFSALAKVPSLTQ